MVAVGGPCAVRLRRCRPGTGRRLIREVAGWLDTLAKVKGFANPYLSTSQLTDGGNGQSYIKYTVTVQLTSEALSHRYTQAGG